MKKIHLFLLVLLFAGNSLRAQNYNMSSTTITTCSGNYYDDGGTSYYTSTEYTQIFYPNPGNKLKFTFSSFDLLNFSVFGFTFSDRLYIYNGNSTNPANLIGVYTGNNSPGIVTSTAADGSLTFQVKYDVGGFFNTGWTAKIDCIGAVPPTITNFTPDNACQGDPINITINGNNLSGVTASNVTIGGTAVSSIVSNTPTQIVATVGAGTTGTVKVITNGGSATSAGTFTFNPLPTVVTVLGGGTFCNSSTVISAGNGGSGTIFFQENTSNGTDETLGGTPQTVTAPGRYYFRAKSASGCWGPEGYVDVILTSSSTPIDITGDGNSCGPATVNATGGGIGSTIYYQGTNSSGTDMSFGATQIINTDGTYYFRAFNGSCGGWGPAKQFTVTIFAVPPQVNVSGGGTLCNSITLTASNGGSGNTIYFQGQTSGGIRTDLGNELQSVNAPGTYYFRSKSPDGCWGPENSAVVLPNTAITITEQPTDQVICAGSNVTFNIIATGPYTGFQWYKGPTAIIGANSSMYTISGATAANNGTDYNCVITYGCGTVTSNYFSLTVNPVIVAPTTQASVLVFPTVGITSLVGTFNVSPNATNYLVVRSNSATLPISTAPVNGTTYADGDVISFGVDTRVEYSGPDNFFTSSGLTAGQTYYYFVWAYNINQCNPIDNPLYKKPPLTKPQATATSGGCPVGNRLKLYWAGTGSVRPKANCSFFGSCPYNNDFQNKVNWSTSSSSYKAANAFPTKCNDVDILVNSNVTIALTANTEFYDLLFKVQGNNNTPTFTTNKKNLDIYGNTEISISSGNNNTEISMGETDGSTASVIDFKQNLVIGASSTTPEKGYAFLIGNNNSKMIVRGDLMLNHKFVMDNSQPGTLELDGGIQQVTYDNLYQAQFKNIVIGNLNNPIVSVISPSTYPDNITGNITINGSSTLDLKTSQWNRSSNGGNLYLNGTSKLLLGGTSSFNGGGSATIPAGSNFPGGFNTTMSATSTVEYNGTNGTTQTIYDVPTYGNLTLRNPSGAGTSYKINTGIIKVAGTANLNAYTLTTLGANIQTQSAAAVVNVNNLSIIDASSKIVGGNGKFNLLTGGTLEMGSSDGINKIVTGLIGNIQTLGTRNFDVGANYFYNGTTPQNSGDALPLTVNNLTIDNPASVSLNNLPVRNYEATSTLTLKSGDLLVNGNTLVINNLTRNSGKLFGSPTSKLTINGTDIPLFLSTSTGGGIFQDLLLNTAKSAVINLDPLNILTITGGTILSPEGSVTIGNSAILTTNDNLVLNSNEFGTSRVAPFGTGGKILGKVSVERYMPVTNKAWHMLSVPTIGSTFKSAWQEGALISRQDIHPGYGINIPTDIKPYSNFLGFDGPSTLSSVRYYQYIAGVGDFIGIPNTNDQINGNGHHGYKVFVRGDRATAGANKGNPTTLRSKGELYQPSVTAPAVVSLALGQWALVGNPYASPINFNSSAITKNNLQDAYNVWDPNGGGEFGTGIFRTIRPGVINPPGGPGSPYENQANPPNIQSGQAIFVQANTVVGTHSLKFDELAKVSGSTNTTYFTSEVRDNPASQLSSILYAFNGNVPFIADGVTTQFSEDYSSSFDESDAEKLANSSENMGIFSTNKILAIERKQLPKANDSIFYNLDQMKIQNYRFAFIGKKMDVNGLQAYLNDNYLNTQTLLNSNDTTWVDFKIENNVQSKSPERFYVTFKPTGPLPISLLSLNAEEKDGDIEVEWKVKNEINVSSYEIERALDTRVFAKAGVVASTNKGADTYSWLDEDVTPGWNYYRIRTVDKDGKFALSNIVKVYIQNSPGTISVNPNPLINGKINLQLKNQSTGNYEVRLLNSLGQTLVRKRISHNNGTNTYLINTDFNMSHEIYQLQITKPNGEVKTIKVIY